MQYLSPKVQALPPDERRLPVKRHYEPLERSLGGMVRTISRVSACVQVIGCYKVVLQLNHKTSFQKFGKKEREVARPAGSSYIRSLWSDFFLIRGVTFFHTRSEGEIHDSGNGRDKGPHTFLQERSWCRVHGASFYRRLYDKARTHHPSTSPLTLQNDRHNH